MKLRPSTMTLARFSYVIDDGEKSTTAPVAVANAGGAHDFESAVISSSAIAPTTPKHLQTRLFISTTSCLALAAAAASAHRPLPSSCGAKNASRESTERTESCRLSAFDEDDDRDVCSDNLTKTEIKVIHAIDAFKIRDPDDDVRLQVIRREEDETDDGIIECGGIFSSLRRKSKRRRWSSRKRFHVVY